MGKNSTALLEISVRFMMCAFYSDVVISMWWNNILFIILVSFVPIENSTTQSKSVNAVVWNKISSYRLNTITVDLEWEYSIWWWVVLRLATVTSDIVHGHRYLIFGQQTNTNTNINNTNVIRFNIERLSRNGRQETKSWSIYFVVHHNFVDWWQTCSIELVVDKSMIQLEQKRERLIERHSSNEGFFIHKQTVNKNLFICKILRRMFTLQHIRRIDNFVRRFGGYCSTHHTQYRLERILDGWSYTYTKTDEVSSKM